MKFYTFLLLCFIFGTSLDAQLNMTYKSHVEYTESLNDIWGYTSDDGREYALVGLRSGVSIIDITDTENPVLRGYASGPSSTWRDLKTYGDYAYVTNETSDGLLVIDLSNLPNELTADDYWYWAPDIAGLGELSSCHNIYIDEFGIAYLVGCNVNAGGMLYVDVTTNPGSPAFIDLGPAVYSHDIYVRDNIAYSSEIFQGTFTIYDVTDKSNTITLGSQSTPFNFTHNTWLSDDSQYIFTTDEQANAPIGAYDISDFNNIQETDQFRPLQTLGVGVIPHNVHVWNDWLIISYYTDGCIIVDGSRPTNLIEVGNFDTFIPASTGFSGAWGAYPYFPSGTVIVSDIGNGCYILEPNYVRACWLEGNVTDAVTGDNISGVSIEIITDELNGDNTNSNGNYATGLATAGTYDVVFSHPAYEDLTATAVLENGEVTILNVQLGAMASQAFEGSVIEAGTGDPIPFAKVFIERDGINYETTTDINGNFSLLAVLEGDYTIYAGSWGHVNVGQAISVQDVPASVTLELEVGYADDFIVDLDWEIETTASTGAWERGIPIGTFTDNGTVASNPGADVEGDVGNQCYVTGNAGGTAANDDVDNGYTRLTSPSMDLTTYSNPAVKFNYWFFNDGGNGSPDDNLTVSINNGNFEVPLQIFEESDSEWKEAEILLADFINITNSMTITFESSDQIENNNGHLVEAAVDAFEIFEGTPTSTFELANDQAVEMLAMPNPFASHLSVSYKFETMPNQANLNIYNILGQQIDQIQLDNSDGVVNINSIKENGIYFLQIEADGNLTEAMRVVKQ